MGLGIRFKIKVKPDVKQANPSEDIDQLTDEELVARSIGGDKVAYQALVKKYQNRLLGRAIAILKNREDAKDIVQEALTKAYFSLKNFRGQSSFYTWVYRILVNLSIDLKRKTARRGGESLELDEKNSVFEGVDEYKGPADVLFRKEQSRKIQEVLSHLSEDHRQAIVLRELEGLSYEEIASTLGISLGTVMSRLFYARKRLQQSLKEFSPNSSSSVDENEEINKKTEKKSKTEENNLSESREKMRSEYPSNKKQVVQKTFIL